MERSLRWLMVGLIFAVLLPGCSSLRAFCGNTTVNADVCRDKGGVWVRRQTNALWGARQEWCETRF